MSRLSETSEVKSGHGIFSTVVCYPLYTVMLAVNYTKLDYLALDLEGLEMQVCTYCALRYHIENSHELST